MTALHDVLSGVLRFFPNTMMYTLLIVGALTGKLSWLFVSFGGMILAAGILTLQYLFNRALGLGLESSGIPGAAVLDACSLIPITQETRYATLPSLWMALTTYFATYILINAAHIYTAQPVHKSRDALPVQQRKGIGMISMLAAALLFVFLVVPRYRTTCETLAGTVLGVGAGLGFAWIWWKVLDACGSDVFPDIHGVMMGLKPGTLHTAPVACTPHKM
jgi:hypothetical protein